MSIFNLKFFAKFTKTSSVINFIFENKSIFKLELKSLAFNDSKFVWKGVYKKENSSSASTGSDCNKSLSSEFTLFKEFYKYNL